MALTINEEFARDFQACLHAAVNTHDATAVVCCDDVVWDDPVASKPLHGREAVRRRCHGNAF